MGDIGLSDNGRRVAEVAKLMVNVVLVVVAALISPFRGERYRVRYLFQSGRFCEVYLQAPLSVCETHDPKGLYSSAHSGKLTSFAGINSPCKLPDAPELVLDTMQHSVEVLTETLVYSLFPNGGSLA